jgi:hypothetical protein
VHVECCGYGRVDRVEERAEVDRPMLGAGRVHDLAGREVQRREQVGDPVTHVVMGASLDLARTHRQRRLGAIERLHARLFIHAHDHGVIRRVHIQPHDITDLLHEQRVLGQLERVDEPGFESERLPDPTDRRR